MWREKLEKDQGLPKVPPIPPRMQKPNGKGTMPTAICAGIAAHSADEAEQQGRKKISPYWRVRKVGGERNPKYPGGVENLSRRLKAEGHKIDSQVLA